MTEEQKPDPLKEKTARAEAKARVEARKIEMEQELLNSQLQLMQAKEAAAAAAERKALRDEFAKAALTGLLAHHGNPNMRSIADSAYQYADFMLDIRDDSTR